MPNVGHPYYLSFSYVSFSVAHFPFSFFNARSQGGPFSGPEGGLQLQLFYSRTFALFLESQGTAAISESPRKRKRSASP